MPVLDLQEMTGMKRAVRLERLDTGSLIRTFRPRPGPRLPSISVVSIINVYGMERKRFPSRSESLGLTALWLEVQTWQGRERVYGFEKYVRVCLLGLTSYTRKQDNKKARDESGVRSVA